MNLLRTSRNITIIALILSLLFHASTVFYVFLQKTHNDFFSRRVNNNLDTAVNQQQQEQQKHTPWVETKARAGNFGAPVFFEDVADEIPDVSAEVEKNLPIEHIQKEEVQQEEILLEENITATQQSIPEVEVPMPQHKEKKLVQTTMTSAPQKPITKATPKKTPTQQKNQTNPFINYPTRENKQKPSLTLAQLTQGFLNQRKEQSGSYGISMLGMKRGIPSDEQMKYERYLQKLSWCLQNSFNINEGKTPRTSADTEIHLFFSLNRDGILQKLILKKSSGSKLLDDFVTFVFQEASQSFPPVPSYLPDNPFQITCIIPIKIRMY